MRLAPLLSVLPALLLALPAGAESDDEQAEKRLSAVDQDLLRRALDEAHRVQSTVAKAVVDVGDKKPLGSLLAAQQDHVAGLVARFEASGLDVPANAWAGRVATVHDRLAACRTTRDAVQSTVALYGELAPQIQDDTLQATLDAARSLAVEDHLPALQKCIDKEAKKAERRR